MAADRGKESIPPEMNAMLARFERDVDAKRFVVPCLGVEML